VNANCKLFISKYIIRNRDVCLVLTTTELNNSTDRNRDILKNINTFYFEYAHMRRLRLTNV